MSCSINEGIWVLQLLEKRVFCVAKWLHLATFLPSPPSLPFPPTHLGLTVGGQGRSCTHTVADSAPGHPQSQVCAEATVNC